MRAFIVFSIVMTAAIAAPAAPFDRLLDLPRDYASHRVTQMAALEPGQTFTVFEAEGPGAITHIWMTVGQSEARGVVLRMYWDGEEDPSVEAPLADFFGVGHNRLEPEHYFATPCLVVAPNNGYNVYMPMPFRKGAKITVTNEQEQPLRAGGGLYFQADYLTFAGLGPEVPYFHAQWRRESTAQRRGRPYTIVEAVGKGFIAGVTLHVRGNDSSDKWFHGGGDLIFLDGASAPNVLKGIGGEDFFGESWGSTPFTSAYAGNTNERNRRISLYRFFLEGPPRFERSVRFAFGAMENEITSVGYWYQTEPHTRFFDLPEPAYRDPGSVIEAGQFDRELLPREQVDAAIMGPFFGTIDTKIPLDGQAKIDTGLAMLTNYGAPYKTVFPDNENRRVQWERTRTTLSWLDFDAAYKPRMALIFGVKSMPGMLGYVLIRMQADGNRSCSLDLGHDDAVRLWLNGKDIGQFEGSQGFKPRVVEIALEKGSNDLLIKAVNAWNVNWATNALSLRFRDTEGIVFESFENLPPTLDFVER